MKFILSLERKGNSVICHKIDNYKSINNNNKLGIERQIFHHLT